MVIVGTVTVALLLHGPVGATLVALAVVVSPPSAGTRAAAGVAVALLVVAALATVMEADLHEAGPGNALAPPPIDLDYALDRGLAVEAGRLAALALLAAIGTAARPAARPRLPLASPLAQGPTVGRNRPRTSGALRYATALALVIGVGVVIARRSRHAVPRRPARKLSSRLLRY